ncbi:MAG: sialate O-acetylesterase [Bacteroidota bacterium]
MRITIQLLVLCSIVCLSSFQMIAKVQVSSIFSDHMVIQQNSMAPIWGRAEPGEMITVIASWDPLELTTYADSKGLWRVDMISPEAGGPYEIIIKASNVIRLEDVWSGEVWIASGQSNMNWPLRRSEGGKEAISKADYPRIRMFQMPREVSTTPRFDSGGEWSVCSPNTAGQFSAVAYFFGRELLHNLDVPIGLIQTSWGGSPAEAWTSREALGDLEAFVPYLEEFDDEMRDFRARPHLPNPVYHKSPTVLFNAMVNPLIPYSIQGVIWYQGESNVADPYLYRQLFPNMIEDWRARWQQAFSFYYVQIAPFQYSIPKSGAGLREAQLLSLKKKNTGMAVSMDIGNPFDIHPTDKRTVGHRLAQWALSKDYGFSEITPSGPVFQKMEKQGPNIRLRFRYAKGLWDGNHALQSFELAGSDRIFKTATARIEGETIVLFHPEILHPVAVRYAFSDTSQAALYNEAGLPASSFRTDDWTEFFTQTRINASYLKEKDVFQVSMEYRQIVDHDIYYRLEEGRPTSEDKLYEGPLTFKGPEWIQAQVFIDGIPSPYPVSRQLRRHLGLGKTLLDSPTPPKQLNGKLLDGLHGTENHRDGSWFGIEGENIVLTVDLGEKKSIQQIGIQFLEHHQRRIFLPEEIRYEVSNNGSRFKELAPLLLPAPEQERPLARRILSSSWKSTKARYVRLSLINPGTLPDWHVQAGGKRLILLDELIIE